MKSGWKITGAIVVTFLCISLAVLETRQQQLQQQLDLFSEFYSLLDKNYVDTLNLPELMKKSMRKTLAELDPYSQYFDIEETKKRADDWKGILYAGIGSTVKQTDSGVVIVEPAEGSAAMKAGLRTGDLIMEINGQNVLRTSLDSVVMKLKGNKGDSVHLVLKRPYAGTIRRSLAKEIITSKAVPIYFMMKDSAGYILYSHFLSGSSDSLKHAFLTLKQMGIKKLVLDLRGNNGGIVEECTSALGFFLPPHSLVCSLRSKDPSSNYSYYTTGAPLDTSIPIIILTDKHCISAGEIFAGCMKDHKRAILVGEKTYGKGFVQGTRFFKGGQSLYVTAARYYTPSGNFIGQKGVEPDLATRPGDSIPPQLQALINSGIIVEYSIKYRNMRVGDKIALNEFSYPDFENFYRLKVSNISLPEEANLGALNNYSSAQSLKNEILERKKQLPLLYRSELQVELKKEILKRYYHYTAATELGFVHSSIFNYLVGKGYLSGSK